MLYKMTLRVKNEGTSKAGISCWTLLTLGSVSEVSAIAHCPWRTGVGWRVGFRGTRGAHKSVKFEAG